MNKIIKNSFWIIACKILQMLLNLVVTMLTARYLGPSNYGLISYAASIVAFVIPVMQLGFRSTLVQEFVQAPEKEGEILGTAVVLNIIGAISCIIGIGAFVSLANAGEQETIVVCVLYSVSLLFQATEIIQYWFQAKLQSKYPSIAMVVSYVIVSIYKIYLLVTGKNVYWFAVSQAIDAFFISIILFYFYKRRGTQKLKVSVTLAKNMFSKSRYYIISGLMVNIFQFTDRIMLKLMLGDEITGYYSAAVVAAGLSSFVFQAIIDSSRPSILYEYGRNEERFKDSVANLFCVIVYLSLAQCVAISLLAKPIVLVLYGKDYLSAVPVLRLVVWYITFSFLGTVRNIWILAEAKQSVLWKINLLGAMTNVILNYILIPIGGMQGAAIASVFTQFFTNVIVGEMMKSIRPCNRILYQSVNPKRVVRLLKKLQQSK